jgi:squalene cyclase
MISKYPHQEIIDKGVQFLLSRQATNGDFPQEGITGVFSKTCMITYTSYRNVFPIWAMQRYLKLHKVSTM